MEVILHNRLTDIGKAHDLVDEMAARVGLSPKATADVHVALEEYVTNAFHYGYSPGQPGQVIVRCQPEPHQLLIVIEDDGRPFNPLLAPRVDVTQPMDQRPVGGLGIHLLRQLTDELHYEHRGGHNLLTMIKRLPG